MILISAPLYNRKRRAKNKQGVNIQSDIFAQTHMPASSAGAYLFFFLINQVLPFLKARLPQTTSYCVPTPAHTAFPIAFFWGHSTPRSHPLSAVTAYLRSFQNQFNEIFLFQFDNGSRAVILLFCQRLIQLQPFSNTDHGNIEHFHKFDDNNIPIHR